MCTRRVMIKKKKTTTVDNSKKLNSCCPFIETVILCCIMFPKTNAYNYVVTKHTVGTRELRTHCKLYNGILIIGISGRRKSYNLVIEYPRFK